MYMYDCIMYNVCACVCKWVCMHAWSYWPQHAAAYFLRVAACPGGMSWPGLHALADSSKNRRTSTLAYWAATINTLSPFWLWRLKSLGPWRSYYWEHIISLSLSLSLSLSASLLTCHIFLKSFRGSLFCRADIILFLLCFLLVSMRNCVPAKPGMLMSRPLLSGRVVQAPCSRSSLCVCREKGKLISWSRLKVLTR